MSIKILHAADLHLDSPFEALTDAQAVQRREEQRALLDALADKAQEQQVDAVVLAGDLLDTGSAYLETAERLASFFRRCAAPVFVAPGNHDYYSPHSPYARMDLPADVHIFRSAAIEAVALPEKGLRVWGGAFTDSQSGPLLRGFSVEKEPGTLDVLVLHGEVGAPASVYNPISEAEIAASGMDYIALGHNHTYSGLRRAGQTFFAWPGCTEGRGFDETGEKGALLVTLEAGRCQAEFLPLGQRRYEIVEVDVTEADDILPAVDAALPGASSRDICRIVLTGETETPPDLPALARALEGRFFSLQLRDKTRLRRPLWAQAGEDTLRGLFLARLRQRYEAAETPQEREAALQAARWGIQALDNGEELL